MYNNATSNSAKGGNKGSCKNLAKYLDKETKNQWFNHSNFDIETARVIQEIDKYGKGQIKKDRWKFVEIEYCPSEKEQIAILEKAGVEYREYENFEVYTAEEIERIKAVFADYVRKAQDLQARNYQREGIETGADLKWFGKIELHRKSKGFEEPYRTLNWKVGSKKPSLNLHCHIIQSRKAMNKKTQLSPLTNFRKESSKNVIKQGFDRNNFTNGLEDLFDREFQNHHREEIEMYETMKYNKFGGKKTRRIGKETFALTVAQEQKKPLEYLLENWQRADYSQIANFMRDNDIYEGDFEEKLTFKEWSKFDDKRSE